MKSCCWGWGLLLFLGCSSTRTKAEGHRVLVEVGMTGRDGKVRIISDVGPRPR